jgi:hypothetical protein
MNTNLIDTNLTDGGGSTSLDIRKSKTNIGTDA